MAIIVLLALKTSGRFGLAAGAILVLLFVVGAAVVARALRAGAGEPPAELLPVTSRCRICGGDAEILCWQCGAVQAGSPGKDLILAAFIVRRWPAIVAVMATCYAPLLVGAVREDDRRAESAVRDAERKAESQAKEQERRIDESASRRVATAGKLAEAWSAFRGPLLSLGAQCAPDVSHLQPLTSGCRDLLMRLAQAYAQVSWYLPAFVVDLREPRCAHAGEPLVEAACAQLAPASPLIKDSGVGFRRLINAVSAYDRHAGFVESDQLARAVTTFYDDTRKLGCALDFAGFAEMPARAGVAGSSVLSGVSPYCEPFLLEGHLDETESLQIATWFAPQTVAISEPAGERRSIIASALKNARVGKRAHRPR